MISLRLNRFESRRLAWALALSLAAHFLVWSGYELGKKAGLWQRLHWPTRTHLVEKKNTPPLQESEPTIFLNVDPDQATPEAPKDAKYYSSKNSQTAQTEPSIRDLNQPKLNGKQTDVAAVKDQPRLVRSQSKAGVEKQSKTESQEKPEPKPAVSVGDSALNKSKDTDQQNRPRTINEALAQTPNLRPSKTIQQDGGTRRAALEAAFNSKATSFGDYDQQMFDSIQQYWFDQLASRNFSSDRIGRVTLSFRLHYDGSITDMEVVQNTVGELSAYICQQAVLVPAPYAKWPSDMRRKIGENYRQMTISFIYY